MTAPDPLCQVCGGPHGGRARDHRYTTACQWALGCPTAAHRGIEADNVLGQRMRNFYCEAHLRDIVSGAAYRRTVDLAGRLGLSADIADPAIVAASEALRLHQDGCDDCGAVRLWVRAEMAAGRVQTIEDRDRVGLYTMEHACADGQGLLSALGRVMLR